MNVYRTKNGTVIAPYIEGQSSILEKSTSTYDHVYHKRIELAGFHMKNFHGMPAFLTSRQSKDFLASEFSKYQIIDVERIRAKKSEPYKMMEGFELRPIQQSLRNQVILNTNRFREWFIHLQTAQGKTVIGTNIAMDFQCKVFIFCFSRDILEQWAKCFITKTTIDPSRVLIIKSSDQLDRLRLGELDEDDYDIYLATHSLISSYMKKGCEKVTELMEVLGIGLAIFDEAHRTLASTIKISALCNFTYSLYLSADFAQADKKKERLFYQFFRTAVVLEPDAEEEISLRYTDIIVVEYNSYPTYADELAIKNRYGYDRNRYMKYQFKNGKVIDVVCKIIDTLYEPKETQKYRMLILFGNIEHVDKMAQILAERYEGRRIVGRFHGGCDMEEKARTQEFADIIVSTYNSFGTGKDIEGFKYVIGMNQSNKIEDNQAAGRARPLPDGSHAKYFMVVDIGFKYCIKKLKMRLEYLVQLKAAKPPFRWRIPD